MSGLQALFGTLSIWKRMSVCLVLQVMGIVSLLGVEVVVSALHPWYGCVHPIQVLTVACSCWPYTSWFWQNFSKSGKLM
mgnify:CR=1 FL=1